MKADILLDTSELSIVAQKIDNISPRQGWGNKKERNQLEIIAIALEDLGYTLAYNGKLKGTIEVWTVTKGKDGGFMHYNPKSGMWLICGIANPETLIPGCLTWL